MRNYVSESLRNVLNFKSVRLFFVLRTGKKIVDSCSTDKVKIWKIIGTIYSVVKSGLCGNLVRRIRVYNFQQKMLERKNYFSASISTGKV